jgi:hypothetical protein
MRSFVYLPACAFRYKAGFFTQLRWLLWRSAIDTFNSPFEFRIRFILSIVIGLLLGLLFLRLEYNQQAFQNISAVIFMLIINFTFSNVQNNADVNLLFEERTEMETTKLCFAVVELQSTTAIVFQRA